MHVQILSIKKVLGVNRRGELRLSTTFNALIIVQSNVVLR